MNFLFDDSTLHDRPSGDSYLNQFAQVLLEPQFQLLESEYHLSQKLLLVRVLCLQLSPDTLIVMLYTIESFNMSKFALYFISVTML